MNGWMGMEERARRKWQWVTEMATEMEHRGWDALWESMRMRGGTIIAARVSPFLLYCVWVA